MSAFGSLRTKGRSVRNAPIAVFPTGHDIRKRLGSNVKRLRLEKGWSQEDYADGAGIHRTYVSDIDRAARNPTISIVEKLAKALKVTASDLLA